MIHPKMRYTYVGIDSHKDTHTAVILNCFCEKLHEVKFINVPGEFENVLTYIEKYRLVGTTLVFGIEDTTAYGRSLTVFLVGKKLKVKHVNSALVANERKSSNTYHKTDSFDAECAARVLINRFDQLPDADPQDKYWVLSQLVTRRRSIVKSNITLKNHLQAYITNHYPSYDKFYTNIDCKSALAFFDKYPSPSKLEGVTVEELEQFLRDVTDNRQYKGKAQKILAYVKKDGDTKTDYQEARDMAVRSTISQLNSNTKEIEQIDIIIENFLDNFDYKLESMKGIDTIMAANLISEIGDIGKFDTPAKLARYAGIAPITHASGKNDIQYSNQRGNRTLNSLFFRLAVAVTMTAGKNKKVVNPIFYEYYQKKMNEGKTKRQALKCVERRLVNIIWSMMKYKREYINPPTMDLPKKEDDKAS